MLVTKTWYGHDSLLKLRANAAAIARLLPRAALLLGLSLTGAVTAHANTITVANCSQPAVQGAIDAAVNGDTVVVPSGSCTWSSTLAVRKAVTIQASGTVTISCGSDSVNLIEATETTSGVIRILGFVFASGSCSTQSFSKHFISVATTASGRPVVIANNTFNGKYGAIRMNTNRGVIAHNTFDGGAYTGSASYNTTEALQAKCEGACNSTAWGAGSTLGALDTDGEHNIYFEDNTIIEHNTETIDFDGSSRVVVRYNTFNQSGLTSHGTDTSTWGNRQWEVYNNTFKYTGGDCDFKTYAPMDYFIYIRGGTGIIADNVIGDINSCATGNKAEIKFAIFNLRQSGAGPHPCWAGGYPSPRQHGMGRVTGTAGDDSFGVYYGDSDPIYIWGNTGAGSATPVMADFEPDQCGRNLRTASFVQQNRDWFASPRPGYTKYTYPHPLRGGATTVPAPSAPINLRIVR